MTLSPLIVALCVNAGPSYNEACKTALEQGAAQTGIAVKVEHLTKRTAKDVIQYINPSAQVELTAAVVGYTYQLISGRQATLAFPNPGIKNSSLSLSVGKDSAGIGFRMGF
jgi:hypothetical protein